MSDESCRIAKLEACIESVKDNFREHCDRTETQQKEMMSILQDVRDKQAKMSGFWAGAAFVVSAAATGLTIFFGKASGN
jgi:uncharacterized protein YukE